MSSGNNLLVRCFYPSCLDNLSVAGEIVRGAYLPGNEHFLLLTLSVEAADGRLLGRQFVRSKMEIHL